MVFKATLAVAALALAVGSGPAFAQQEGLVNVNVEGVNIQVPVGVAAQVCPNVSANVIAEARGTQTAVCEIDQATAAEHNIAVGQGQGQGQDQGQQSGLVNVNVEGVNVQVPVGIAAQICPNVSANVIAESVGSQTAVCDIDQETAAQHNIGVGQGQGQAQGQGQSQEQGLGAQGQGQEQGQGQSQQ